MKTLFGTCALTLNLLVHAQLGTLSFSHQQGLFTPLANYPNASVISHIVSDDFVCPARIALPFNFHFNGQLRDSVNISENGFIWFGGNDPIMQVLYNPISSTSTLHAIISALGMDLEPNKIPALPSSLKSGVVGTAPYRIQIVEWLNTSRHTPSTHADTLSFQIKLYETSNKVEFSYGSFKPDLAISSGAEVGLRGAPGDFRNRKVVSGNWSSSAAGTLATDLCVLSAGSQPEFGQLFVWERMPATVPEIEKRGAPIVYPNPVHDVLVVTSPNDKIKTRLSIYDLNGRLLFEERETDRLQLSDLDSGVYILAVKMGTQIFKEKLIKN